MGGPEKKPDKQTQADKFKRLAREVGADEDEQSFKDKLKRLAKAKPKPKSEESDR